MKNNDYIKYTPNLCCIIKNKKIEEEEYQLFNNYNSIIIKNIKNFIKESLLENIYIENIDFYFYEKYLFNEDDLNKLKNRKINFKFFVLKKNNNQDNINQDINNNNISDKFIEYIPNNIYNNPILN